MNILQACQSPRVFGPWFKDPASWEAWFAFLSALFGLPMTDEQLAIYRKHTDRQDAPKGPQGEAYLICGRRAGKSFIMALAAVYLATFRQYREYLQPGERATVAVIAADRKQARIVVRYIRAMLHEIPTFRSLLERETSEAFDLSGQVTIEVQTASATSTRGYTYAGVICDEIAHWPTGDGVSESDEDILAAIKPGMLTIPNPVLLCASSPHARRGAMWKVYSRHFGREGGPLVWQAETTDMNPKADRGVIAKAYQDDPSAAAAEFGAQFRRDIESYIARETVEACVMDGVKELSPTSGVRFQAFADASGGAVDSYTLAIGYEQAGRVVLAALRERKPPFSPDDVTREYAELLKTYGIRKVTADRYSGAFAPELWRKHGIEYAPAEHPASELYRGLLAHLNSRTIDLLDHPVLVDQMVSLERRVTRTGREQITHPPRGHDDVANAVAGLASLCARKVERPKTIIGSWSAFGQTTGGADPLPLPSWALNPLTEEAAANAAAYLSRRGGQ